MKDILIHQTLRRLLDQRGLSISRLARITQVPHSTLSTWLTPGARPSDPTQIAAVAHALGTTMHHLLFDETEHELALETLPGEVFLEGIYRIRLEKIATAATSRTRSKS